jgi:hypothetical protein
VKLQNEISFSLLRAISHRHRKLMEKKSFSAFCLTHREPPRRVDVENECHIAQTSATIANCVISIYLHHYKIETVDTQKPR